MKKATACECTQPGWCERHRCYKSRQLFLMCSRLPELFQQWEMQAGPGQDGKAPRPLPPCQLRGAEPLEWVTCLLCGLKDVKIPVFACDVHGKCSERRFNQPTSSESVLMSCTGCREYAPIDDDS